MDARMSMHMREYSASSSSLPSMSSRSKSDSQHAKDEHAAPPSPSPTPMPLSDQHWQTRIERIRRFTLKNFLVLGLVTFVIGGALVPQPGRFFNDLPTFYVCVSVIFFIAGIRLSTDEVKEGLRAWKGGLYGIVSILFLTPLLAFVILRSPIPNSADFRLGLVVFVNSPTTLTSGPILTSAAKGNLPLALLLTVATNLLCVVTIPFVLDFTLTGADLEDFQFAIDSVALLQRLLLIILLPLVVGNLLRRQSKRVGQFASSYKTQLKLLSSFALILIPWMKVSDSSDELANTVREQPGDFFLMLLVAILIHVVFLVFNWCMCSKYLLRLKTRELRAVVIMTAQKTLPITVAVISLDAFADAAQGLMSIAAVCAHISQIVMDGFLASRWSNQPLEDLPKEITDSSGPSSISSSLHSQTRKGLDQGNSSRRSDGALPAFGAHSPTSSTTFSTSGKTPTSPIESNDMNDVELAVSGEHKREDGHDHEMQSAAAETLSRSPLSVNWSSRSFRRIHQITSRIFEEDVTELFSFDDDEYRMMAVD